jgi:all-trans-8'-apo-beta-carotenal 15,15'-oxygenase
VVDPSTGEANYEITVIEGELPNDLVGVLYRNGPGKFGVDGERVSHILDADGLLLRFEFSPPEEVADDSSRVKFTSRFVETAGFLEEREKNQFTKRGTFGTCPTPVWYRPPRNGINEDPSKPPLMARMAANAFNVDIKNTANTQVVAFGGKLLALWEAGMPYEIDPVTLATIGIDSLGLDRSFEGKLAVNYVPGIPEEFQPDMLGGLAHTAHPKVCPRTGHLVGWTWAQNPLDGSMEVTFTEYDSDGFEIVASDTHVLKDCALAPHDMVLTEHYVMLKINSLEMDQVSFLSGAKGPAECLRMDGRAQVKAFVFPRPTLSAKEKEQYRPFVVEDIPACFSIHFSHGYEDEKTGNIVSYFSGWPPSDSETFLGAWGGFSPDYDKIPPTYYWRLEIDPSTQTCMDLRVSPGQENMCIEHPVVHPNVQTRDATFAYAQCCNKVGDASAPMGYAKLRLDGVAPVQLGLEMGDMNDAVDVYWLGSRRFAGEPLVVPKRGSSEKETEAYLLGLVYDSVRDQSSLMVFDLERELKQGPVCKIWLKTALPHGLHGCFAPDSSVQTSCFC